ncbi:hypothetical protein JYU34_019237 [Plutella xylostella]|uniref:Kazal-like domain-containing protein n=1 Tax=Plutella xylostella TaxID=51655 RepID=A0ABQ7PWC9_PLUXY|nr:hypothetical protein JYU34_019237 [Plutella xylostella]
MARVSLLIIAVICILVLFSATNAKSKKKKSHIGGDFYPKGTRFFVTDLFVSGCKTFLDTCGRSYKYQEVCGQDYNGDYKTFENYCLMEYENCNTWKNWKVFKKGRC